MRTTSCTAFKWNRFVTSNFRVCSLWRSCYWTWYFPWKQHVVGILRFMSHLGRGVAQSKRSIYQSEHKQFPKERQLFHSCFFTSTRLQKRLCWSGNNFDRPSYSHDGSEVSKKLFHGTTALSVDTVPSAEVWNHQGKNLTNLAKFSAFPARVNVWNLGYICSLQKWFHVNRDAFEKKLQTVRLRRNDQVLAGSHDMLVMAVIRVRFFYRGGRVKYVLDVFSIHIKTSMNMQ